MIGCRAILRKSAIYKFNSWRHALLNASRYNARAQTPQRRAVWHWRQATYPLVPPTNAVGEDTSISVAQFPAPRVCQRSAINPFPVMLVYGWSTFKIRGACTCVRTSKAAATPAIAPNRCASHEMPGWPGRTPQRIEPYSTPTTIATARVTGDRSTNPRATRKPNHPNTRPDAPIWMAVFPNSQTSAPPKAMITAFTTNSARVAVAASKAPIRISGGVFEMRCGKLACRSGMPTIPSNPVICLGISPNARFRRYPTAQLRT